jgi:hypothetical protein
LWAYTYHDWEAVPLLIFIMHSALYNSNPKFMNALKYVYCPYVTMLMFFQFTTNIKGLTWWPNSPISGYYYGFYPYSIPVVEQGAIIFYVWSFYKLLSVIIHDEKVKAKRQRIEKNICEKINRSDTNIFY